MTKRRGKKSTRSKQATRQRTSIVADTSNIRELRDTLGQETLSRKFGVSTSTIRRWVSKGVPKSRIDEIPNLVLSPQEILESKAKKYAKKAIQEIPKSGLPSDAPGLGKQGKQEVTRYKGYAINNRIKQIVNVSNEEEIVHKIKKKLQQLQQKQDRGTYFVTFNTFEYGKFIGTSPGEKLYRDKEGDFYRTYMATNGAGSISGVEDQIRALFHEIQKHPQSAVYIDSFTVKRYVEKSEREQDEYRRKR